MTGRVLGSHQGAACAAPARCPSGAKSAAAARRRHGAVVQEMGELSCGGSQGAPSLDHWERKLSFASPPTTQPPRAAAAHSGGGGRAVPQLGLPASQAARAALLQQMRAACGPQASGGGLLGAHPARCGPTGRQQIRPAPRSPSIPKLSTSTGHCQRLHAAARLTLSAQLGAHLRPAARCTAVASGAVSSAAWPSCAAPGDPAAATTSPPPAWQPWGPSRSQQRVGRWWADPRCAAPAPAGAPTARQLLPPSPPAAARSRARSPSRCCPAGAPPPAAMAAAGLPVCQLRVLGPAAAVADVVVPGRRQRRPARPECVPAAWRLGACCVGVPLHIAAWWAGRVAQRWYLPPTCCRPAPACRPAAAPQQRARRQQR